MGVGDDILAAGQAQRLYDADPSTRIAIVDLDGRPRWADIWAGNPIIAHPADVASGEHARTIASGPGCRPYIVYPFTKETGWTFHPTFKCREHMAKIYLTPAERARGEQARQTYGPYVLIEPHTKHDNFRWPLERWQQLVAACSGLTFVQHMHKGSGELLNGVAWQSTTFREACGLVASADLYVRSESGMCHAAAALGVPQVTLFGGCMDPDVMGGYPLQTVIADDGLGSPCGSWLPCDHCAACMNRITVARVERAIRARLKERRAA